MRVFWERTGVLGPVYRLVGRGLSDHEIAERLNISEVKVKDCIAWLLHFMRMVHRKDLAVYAADAVPANVA